MRVLLPLIGLGLCHATDDVTLSAVSALRGAAAAVVEEATKVIGASASGDGEAEATYGYDNSSAHGRRLGAPPTAMGYKGIEWSPISVYGSGVKHIFAIGDWGGMDGSLMPCCGRPQIIAYSGGNTPGPHVFPRS
eukprot:symbB.v1.2.029583.t1/scaffold3257.1/size60124/3